MSNVKFKSIVAACVFAVLLAIGCAGINVVKADAAANGVPTISDTVTKGVPGEMTVENEIKTALMPVGHCLYIFGGSWNADGAPDLDIFADQGAGEEAMTLGVPQVWDNFYKTKDGSYDCWADEYMFMDDDWTTVLRPDVIHWGADCSGYMGWVLQNTINKEFGFGTEPDSIGKQPGWVCYAEDMGYALEHSKYGTFTKNSKAVVKDPEKDPYGSIDRVGDTDFRPGDLYTYGKGQTHVWMCLGKCDDGSVLLVHSSEPGVFICGTVPAEGATSKASALSSEYMKRYYTDFYNKFGAPTRVGAITSDKSASEYLMYSQFKWDEKLMTDSANLRNMSASQVMQTIYCEANATATLNFTGQAPVIHFNDALVEPSAAANSQIVYNRDRVTDTTVDVSFAIPAGYKFDSVKINDVDYSAGLVADSNIAKVNVPISGDYKIECASSEVGVSPATEIAKTGDMNFAVIAICMLLIIAGGILITKKEF